jgi:hypothetical protein
MTQSAPSWLAAFPATGEVGLLGEEGAQRLLAIFAEAATACLAQISELSSAHGAGKFLQLWRVGLDLVARWDRDVVHEEAVRMQADFPETHFLHSFAYLWLLDRLVSDRDLEHLAVPPLAEVYSIFMTRVARHGDVVKGLSFLGGPEAHRRCVFVDAFRGSYHDVLQASLRARSSLVRPISRPIDVSVKPHEAASQVGRLSERIVESLAPRKLARTESADVAERQLSLFEREMERQAEGAAARPPLPDELVSHAAQSRAVSLSAKSLCFFSEERKAEEEARAC